jgi:predicted alpha/beta superfamily hydrolase
MGAASVPLDRPILILLDSFCTFGTAVDAVGVRSIMGELEPAVVVGVGYPVTVVEEVGMRTRDLTPSASAGPGVPVFIDAMLGSERGGADAFLAFLLDELVPEICRRVTKASPTRRALFGHSLAGLFVAHALTTRPEAFETFAANSPSLWWNDFEVARRLDGLGVLLQARGVAPRVLVGAGGREQEVPEALPPGLDPQEIGDYIRRCRMVDAAGDFAAGLKAAGLTDVQTVVFADETHGSVVPAAVGRAVTFALGAKR